jgi:hypothetical protein
MKGFVSGNADTIMGGAHWDIYLGVVRKKEIKCGNITLSFVRVDADTLDDKVIAEFPNARL